MMKLAALFLFAGCTIAAEAPSFPQAALLVFPSPTNSTSTTSTPAPASNDKENLGSFNADLMERLKQQTGSQQGVYHVYLPDGRLQRVQYTAAPVQQQVSNQQDQNTPVKVTADQREGRSMSVVPQAVYFVQLPTDQLQNIKTPDSSNATQQTNLTADQVSNGQVNASSQYKEAAPSEQPQYLPITVVTVDQLSQLRTAKANSEQSGFSSANQQQQDSNSQQQLASNDQQSVQPTEGQNKEYVANLRFTQVDPIAPPIYSYSPLVRILRYATD